ncbi:MAG: hypothetical protein J6O51_02395 [Bacteroidales bacterium]|nr:hypothetical protein [Bacteroidales bacterium]
MQLDNGGFAFVAEEELQRILAGEKPIRVSISMRGKRYITTIGYTITCYRNGTRYDEVYPKYEPIGTHTGRKTFICFMLSIGIAPQVVMKFTGHADYKSMKPYIDIAEKAKTDAMDAMERALAE